MRGLPPSWQVMRQTQDLRAATEIKRNRSLAGLLALFVAAMLVLVFALVQANAWGGGGGVVP